MHVHSWSGTRNFCNSRYRRRSCSLSRCAGQCQLCVRSSTIEYKRMHACTALSAHFSTPQLALTHLLPLILLRRSRHTQETRKTHARHTPSASVAHVTCLFPENKAVLHSTHGSNGTHRIVISILDFKEVVILAVAHLAHHLTLLNHDTGQPLLTWHLA